MTTDTMENRPFRGDLKGVTGVVYPSPAVQKVGQSQKKTIRRRV